MDDKFLLEQLVKACRKVRAKQRAYYSLPGSPREDAFKRACLEESKVAERDLDKLLNEIEKVHPIPAGE